MTAKLSKAEKLARAMDGVMSGGRAFNRQLAAQIRDELRRAGRAAPPPGIAEVVALGLALIEQDGLESRAGWDAFATALHGLEGQG